MTLSNLFQPISAGLWPAPVSTASSNWLPWGAVQDACFSRGIYHLRLLRNVASSLHRVRTLWGEVLALWGALKKQAEHMDICHVNIILTSHDRLINKLPGDVSRISLWGNRPFLKIKNPSLLGDFIKDIQFLSQLGKTSATIFKAMRDFI